MKKVTKLILAGSAAMVLAGGGFAFAQQARQGGLHQRPSPETMGRMLDGNLAFAKTALKLTPEQDKLWPAVEQVVRDNMAERQKLMTDRMAARDPAPAAVTGDTAKKEARSPRPRPDTLKMLEGRSAMATLEAKQSTKLLEALKPLYATMNEEQKGVLPMALFRTAGHGGPGGRHRG